MREARARRRATEQSPSSAIFLSTVLNHAAGLTSLLTAFQGRGEIMYNPFLVYRTFKRILKDIYIYKYILKRKIPQPLNMAATLLPSNKNFQAMQVGESNFRNCPCVLRALKAGGLSNPKVILVQKPKQQKQKQKTKNRKQNDTVRVICPASKGLCFPS